MYLVCFIAFVFMHDNPLSFIRKRSIPCECSLYENLYGKSLDNMSLKQKVEKKMQTIPCEGNLKRNKPSLNANNDQKY